MALHSEHTVGLETGKRLSKARSGRRDVRGHLGAPGWSAPGNGGASSVGGAGPGAPRHAVRPRRRAEGRLGSRGRPRPRGHLGALRRSRGVSVAAPASSRLAPASAAAGSSLARAELHFRGSPGGQARRAPQNGKPKRFSSVSDSRGRARQAGWRTLSDPGPGPEGGA